MVSKSQKKLRKGFYIQEAKAGRKIKVRGSGPRAKRQRKRIAEATRNIKVTPKKKKNIRQPTIDLTKKKTKKKGFIRENIINPIKRGMPKSIGGESDASLLGDVAFVATGGMSGFGAGAGGLSKAGEIKAGEKTAGSITKMKSAHEINKLTGSMMPRGTIQTQKGFLSGIKSSSGVEKLFKTADKIERSKTGAVKNFASNSKTTKLAETKLNKVFSKNTLALLGGWASAVFLGQWGQAEAGEPLSIVMRDAMKQAEETGDWSIYEEAKNARDEITNMETWEKIAMWSPFAPFIGIPNKMKGVKEGGIILDKIAEDKKIQQETGETESQKWERIRKKEEDLKKSSIDYYNEERKKMVEWELEAKEKARKKEAEYWRKERIKQYELEKKENKAMADFWEAYRKEVQKQKNDLRPSNLNFGLL